MKPERHFPGIKKGKITKQNKEINIGVQRKVRKKLIRERSFLVVAHDFNYSTLEAEGGISL